MLVQLKACFNGWFSRNYYDIVGVFKYMLMVLILQKWFEYVAAWERSIISGFSF